MKNMLLISAFLLLSAVAASLAHHPAADIVDEEIYARIDEMVADTPHADIDFDDMDGDVVITITTQDVMDVEDLIDDGLVTYAASLSGRVSVDIELNGGGGRTILTITQIK